MYYVYILRWNKYYVWYTSDIDERIKSHLNWFCKTTKKLKIEELVWYFEKENKTEAIKLENIIKRNWHIEYRINHRSFVKINKSIAICGCNSIG